MDPEHGELKDRLRPLTAAPSRRDIGRAVAGLALAGPLRSLLGLEDAEAKKKKRKHKKKKCRQLNQGCGGKNKKCCKGLTCADGTCLTPSQPDCVDDSNCGANEICQNDVCVPEPPECFDDSVQAAIDAAAPGKTLTLCAGAFTETIEINKNLTLIGTGAGAGPGNTILDGADAGTVVTIGAGSTVTLQNLRITGGSGNAVGNGGGIYNLGMLTLTDCTVVGNTADAFGGGTNNHGTLMLTDCTVSGNTAGGTGGGITNRGTLTLTDCTVVGNTSGGFGGGILNTNGGTVELIDSSVIGNTADDAGGGIYNQETVTCSGRSTVRDNTRGEAHVSENCIDDGGTGCATCPA